MANSIIMKKYILHTYRIIPFLLAVLLSFSAAQAMEIDEIISASPSWKTFTNKDGSGLYHEILKEIFTLYNIPVRHEYATSGRAEELVRLNIADMKTCNDIVLPALIMARYPMYENDFYVFFKKERIGPWRGSKTLTDKEILIQPGYYTESNFNAPVRIKEVMTSTQALSMILLGRSDFYVDDRTLIEQAIKDTTISFNMADYDIQKAGRRLYYPLFNATERGKAIMKLYEDGILQLHKNGKLKPIYDKWGYSYPDFDSF